MISSALFEEFIEDCKRLKLALEMFEYRWTKYGDKLHHMASESQMNEINSIYKEFAELSNE